MNQFFTFYRKINLYQLLLRFVRSVWFFPSILLTMLIIFTVLQVSGSSIGVYSHTFYGEAKNPKLLFNNPRPIRSDEWLVSTQLTIAQHAAGYPKVNSNIMGGRDMTVVADAPTKDWSTIFRPQNWAFFVMPLEYAFAFKWWVLLFLVIVSCYFFTLHVFSNKKIFAALFSTGVGLTPFLFWWYTTGTFGPIFYGFFILLVSMKIIDGKKIFFLKKRRLVYSHGLYAIVLAYLLTAFALILYPPFQIPIAIVIAAVIVGYLLEKFNIGKKFISKEFILTVSTFVIGCVLALTVLFLFIQTRGSVITSIQNTVYPGNRMQKAGTESPVNMLSTYLQPQLQRSSSAAHYYTNQSEASSFLMFLPFLLLPGFIIIVLEYHLRHRINWILLSIQLCACLFLAESFIPIFQPIYNLLLFNKIGASRLRIGLGFLGILQIIYILRSNIFTELPKKSVSIGVGVYSTLCFVVLLLAGYSTIGRYPLFLHNYLFVFVLAAWFSVLIFCFLTRRFVIGSLLFLGFSFGAVFHINPVYKGLAPLYGDSLAKTMVAISPPHSNWVSLDELTFENFASIGNRNSVGGVQPYPNLTFWRQLGGTKNDYIYNRYAHVLFTTHPAFDADVKLIQPDLFEVRFSCIPFIQKNVQFVLSAQPIDFTCTKLIDTVKYPAITFYIYKMTR